MSEPTVPPAQTPDNSEPATGPVLTPPSAPAPLGPPQPMYVQETSRLNKVAAWVGIVAGTLFIVVVIFGTGFLIGKHVGDGPREHHRKGHETMRQGPAMPPAGPRGDFERRPGFPGPFGPGSAIIEIPRPPGGSGGPDGPPGPPPRP